MSRKQQRSDDDFLITFADVVHILRRNKAKIVLATLLFGLLGMWYTMSRPMNFTAEATFREKGKSNAGIGKSLSEMLLSGSPVGHESEAISLMKSRKLKDKLVHSLGLQADLQEQGAGKGRLQRILDNLKIQYAHIKHRQRPLFADVQPAVVCQAVDYSGEVPLTFEVAFDSDEAFSLKNLATGESIGEGRVWFPFEGDNFRFTLACPGNENIAGRKFNLSLQPAFAVADGLKKSIKITPDKNDKSLIVLQYNHPDRYKAALVLNELMNAYQEFLQEEHDQYADLQLEYLKKRQSETLKDYVSFMQGYAEDLEDDLENTGLFDVEKEMEFLLETQRRYHQKLSVIDLSSKRLQRALADDEIFFDTNFTEGGSSNINHLFQALDELKEQNISLHLALQQAYPQNQDGNAQEILSKYGNELQDLHRKVKEIKFIIAALHENRPVDPTLPILQDSHLLVGQWCENLRELTQHGISREDWNQQKATCLLYLENLVRLMEVQERTLEERLSYHYDPEMGVQGFTLESANALYREYIMQSHKLESDTREYNFAFKQIDDPNFEIFSLSSILRDPLSQDIIAKSGALALQLRDQNNRSNKELERIQTELDMHKHFLKVHTEQTIKLFEIRADLLQEKIYALQAASLELVNQKISIIEQHIQEWIASRLISLRQERELIGGHLQELNLKMAKLPKKWVTEQMMKQNVLLNKAVIEEITRLVEGKNITNKLEIIQSSPLDLALVPILPNSPRLFLFVVVGALAGAFMSCGFFLMKSLFTGVEASCDNLQMAHQHVSGILSNQCGDSRAYLDQDLETLRRLIAFYEERSTSRGQPLLILEGAGPDYANALARLISKKGKRVLCMPISFEQAATPAELPGLLQVLEGEAAYPKINSLNGYDSIAAGGICRYSSELICSPRFQELMRKLQENYDVIIAASKAQPCSAEAEALTGVFPLIAVTLADEKLLSLKFYTTLSKPVTFLLRGFAP